MARPEATAILQDWLYSIMGRLKSTDTQIVINRLIADGAGEQRGSRRYSAFNDSPLMEF